MSERTRPPSYDTYLPVEAGDAIIDTEWPQLQPEHSPSVNALITGFHGERRFNTPGNETDDVDMTWTNDRQTSRRSLAREVHLPHQPHAHTLVLPLQQFYPESNAPVEFPQLSPLRSGVPAPNHVSPQWPKNKITYTFSPIGLNAMVLLPQPSAQDSRPQYYIAVSMNCFMPLSHITTVYRGANEYAPRVGEFELGIISVSNSRVQMGDGHSVSLLSVLTKHGSRENARWNWIPHNTSLSRLYWDASTVPFECKVKFAGSEVHTLVAQFTSNMQPVVGQFAGPKPTPALSHLDVFPAGQKCFDDILMSLLVVERKRLTPKTKTEAQLRTLFNY